MSPHARTPKDDSKVSAGWTYSTHSSDQLQPPYPQTLKLAQGREDKGNLAKTHASWQPPTGSSTGRSFSEGSPDKPASYLSVKRAWGNTTQGNSRPSKTGYSPMSIWEHGSVSGEPWNGVGEVAAIRAAGSDGSVKRSPSENQKSKKSSVCATMGSSKKASSGSRG